MRVKLFDEGLKIAESILVFYSKEDVQRHMI
jgi:hypothetical protein